MDTLDMIAIGVLLVPMAVWLVALIIVWKRVLADQGKE